jgi:hypothetical protein
VTLVSRTKAPSRFPLLPCPDYSEVLNTILLLFEEFSPSHAPGHSLGRGTVNRNYIYVVDLLCLLP